MAIDPKELEARARRLRPPPQPLTQTRRLAIHDAGGGSAVRPVVIRSVDKAAQTCQYQFVMTGDAWPVDPTDVTAQGDLKTGVPLPGSKVETLEWAVRAVVPNVDTDGERLGIGFYPCLELVIGTNAHIFLPVVMPAAVANFDEGIQTSEGSGN